MATNQAKMKGTNIYDGGIMIFLNYPLIILLWETWTNYYILVYTHRKELRKVMGVWGSHAIHYYY
jgi:hypothetical protein